jgi:hypothetical protein
VAEGRPVEIAMSDLRIANGEVHAGAAIGETAAGTVEKRVRGWLRRLPGE